MAKKKQITSSDADLKKFLTQYCKIYAPYLIIHTRRSPLYDDLLISLELFDSKGPKEKGPPITLSIKEIIEKRASVCLLMKE